MTKHIKGEPVRNWQDLVDCLHAGHQLWIDQCVLSAGQLRGWTFARLSEKMALGKIWRAVLPAMSLEDVHMLCLKTFWGAPHWIDTALKLIDNPPQEIMDSLMLFVVINENPDRYMAYVDRQWQRDKEAAACHTI